jgi:hypothetical protein
MPNTTTTYTKPQHSIASLLSFNRGFPLRVLAMIIMIDKSNVSAKNLSKYATSREHGHVEQPPTILRRVAF